MNNLSQKEKFLLQDQKSHEEICVQKYQAYAKQARNPHLRQIFTAHAQQENQHLQTINQIISGQMPTMGGQLGSQMGAQMGGQMGGSQMGSQMGGSQSASMGGFGAGMGTESSSMGGYSMMGSSTGMGSQPGGMGQQTSQPFYQSAGDMSAMSGQPDQGDAALCRDMLMTEKYVSGAYNMAIFEFSEPAIRQALNHIQADEQQHGEDLFNFMQSHGLYN